jgi:predicted DNA-binding ArsR family transcriptional regulator
VALMRQVCINYLCENQDNPDILPFLVAEDVQETFQRIVKMGEEAEGVTLLAMARGLNVNIVHYTIYRNESQVQPDIQRQKIVYEASI